MRKSKNPVTLQRRHYEFIAKTIRAAKLGKKAKRKLAEHFAGAMLVTNDLFQPYRFIDACMAE